MRQDRYEFPLSNKNCKMEIIDSNKYKAVNKNNYVIIDKSVYKNK